MNEGEGCPLCFSMSNRDSHTPHEPGLRSTLHQWWRENVSREGWSSTVRKLVAAIFEFATDSTPERRRQRYGDVDYDWDYRVDTTSATVGWRDRLLGALYSPYQPTEPGLFHEMFRQLAIDFCEFTFIDLGSGKGRVLLMAADYPFRRIVGIELLQHLHQVAEENIRKYKSAAQKCFAIESVCGDAREFIFPPEPTVLYLFNPLPEVGLERLIANLDLSLQRSSRPVYVIYHNPLLEPVVARCTALKKIGGTNQYSLYGSGAFSARVRACR
jgi:SAM-dependent methyltransferase